MIVTTKAIVISSLKYQDKGLVVKCFTKSDGLKSYYVPNAFSTRKGAPKAAYFQPMTLLEIEAVHKNKGTLESFKEIRIDYPYTTLHSDVVKGTIAMFLSEMLHYSIHEEERNESLFDLLEAAFHWLDHHEEVANFHLILLLEVTKHLGFYPDVNDTEGRFFDLRDGHFHPSPDADTVSESETTLLRKLTSLRFGSDEKTFSGGQRRALLKILVSYYAFHLEGFRQPKSLEVLAEVFQ